MVVGDYPVLDIANSKTLGMKAIHIVQEGVPSDQADRVVRNVLEAVKLQKVELIVLLQQVFELMKASMEAHHFRAKRNDNKRR